MMKRRDFITLLGGAAVWPIAARAQQRERVRRIGVISALSADDPRWQTRGTTFVQALAQLGWIEGRNMRIDYRFASGDGERQRKFVAELVAFTPDVILCSGGSTLVPLLQATQSVPIVFVNVNDPVGAGYVASLAQPGRNATGFTPFENSFSAKWMELLKQIAPRIAHVAVMRDPSLTSGTGQLAAIQAVAPSFGVDVRPMDLRGAGANEDVISAFAREPNGGLIVVASPSAVQHRQLMIELAAKYRLPAIYPWRFFVASGGLISYGPDDAEPYREAAGYVDRILKGEKPADLPVQAPTKLELAINLGTAKALGLTVPPSLLAIADEVIE
jgi:putative ABC transport system substrate-binding protein